MAAQTGRPAQQHYSGMECSLSLCFLLVCLTCSFHSVHMVGRGCGWAGMRQPPALIFSYWRARASEGTEKLTGSLMFPLSSSNYSTRELYTQFLQALHFQSPHTPPVLEPQIRHLLLHSLPSQLSLHSVLCRSCRTPWSYG